MYDYRMVFVYPLSLPVEDLDGLEESALNALEKSITKSVDDGWQYVSTATFSNPKPHDASGARRGLKSFVYRRLRQTNAEFSGSEALALMNTVKTQSARTEKTLPPPAHQASRERKKTTFLTIAMLNAVRMHSQIMPETVIPKLTRQGEITSEEQKILSTSLKHHISAAQIAGTTPPGHEKDVFRVSLLPFGNEDGKYADYLAELAVYLDLDEDFVRREVAAKHL